MESGAAKNKTSEQNAFRARMTLRSVGNGGGRRTKIRLHYCDIRRSWSSDRRNLT